MNGKGEGGPSDREIAHLETLFRVTQGSLQRQLDHFHAIENKVWKHAALLGIVLGAFAVSIPTVLKEIEAGSGIPASAFAVSYFLTLLVSLAGLFCFAMAMRYEMLDASPLSSDFVRKHSKKGYARSLVALARGAESAYMKNRRTSGPIERKLVWAKRGWGLLQSGLVLILIALISFLILVL